MCQLKGANSWSRVGKIPFTSSDVYVAIALQNFVSKRRNMDAFSPIKAVFDSFQIHSAQEIIESEI
jgi:hypothetical protein